MCPDVASVIPARVRRLAVSPLRRFTASLADDRGFGLVAAIFVVVILAMFGLLVARYTLTSSVSSAEDSLWAQALYSAESAAQLRILNHDGGGSGWPGFPTISGFTTTADMDTFTAAGAPAILTTRANRAGMLISRTVEVNFIL